MMLHLACLILLNTEEYRTLLECRRKNKLLYKDFAYSTLFASSAYIDAAVFVMPQFTFGASALLNTLCIPTLPLLCGMFDYDCKRQAFVLILFNPAEVYVNNRRLEANINEVVAQRHCSEKATQEAEIQEAAARITATHAAPAKIRATRTAANGIVTAYLQDGDLIRLGSGDYYFYAPLA